MIQSESPQRIPLGKREQTQIDYSVQFSGSYQRNMRVQRQARAILNSRGFVETVYVKNLASDVYKSLTGDTNTKSMLEALKKFEALYPKSPEIPFILDSARRVALGMSHVIQDYYQGTEPKEEALKQVIDSKFEPFNRLFISTKSDDYSLKSANGKLILMLHLAPDEAGKKSDTPSFEAKLLVDLFWDGEKGSFLAEREQFSSIEEIAHRFLIRKMNPDT